MINLQDSPRLTIQLLSLQSFENLGMLLESHGCRTGPDLLRISQKLRRRELQNFPDYAKGIKNIEIAIVDVWRLGFPPQEVLYSEVCRKALEAGFWLPSWQMAVGLRLALFELPLHNRSIRREIIVASKPLAMTYSTSVGSVLTLWGYCERETEEVIRVLDAKIIHSRTRLHTESDRVALVVPAAE